ncbi:hypothetical protein ACFFSH_39005 [Streptomyces filamentosus]|uniref:Uncharacterized protein n=1 Tax=Streptomyces filamentosus TaxID=67294 RepID=A0A919BPM2_STRFL|nr:hypothetical protein [Streptomyces filamentosus]GHG04141.1 hypothetical protein GCM10017667_38180 [Streptomyces filamentosus]
MHPTPACTVVWKQDINRPPQGRPPRARHPATASRPHPGTRHGAARPHRLRPDRHPRHPPPARPRPPHEHLAAKVLSWKHGGGTPPPQADIDQAALTLAGYARLLIDELHRTTAALLPTAPARQRARALCANAATLLATPALSPTGTLDPALARAQLVADLHTELDSLHPADPSGPHPAGDETP